ncbi:hypothetical protein B0J12DRAFT_84398 [Macrophomina phaseolina]|uniref:Secreted protein n=1 Tax=Macrophomina phaseolina TaxID=35725 RepID=A0ABQ8GCA1_9PEZI|nr:hypothetical protein B0J12DRAFT_84398 [Macrophomina phaseolina]
MKPVHLLDFMQLAMALVEQAALLAQRAFHSKGIHIRTFTSLIQRRLALRFASFIQLTPVIGRSLTGAALSRIRACPISPRLFYSDIFGVFLQSFTLGIAPISNPQQLRHIIRFINKTPMRSRDQPP